MHHLSCVDCWKVFNDKDELSKHSSNCQNERKRKRMDASLLLDVDGNSKQSENKDDGPQRKPGIYMF